MSINKNIYFTFIIGAFLLINTLRPSVQIISIILALFLVCYYFYFKITKKGEIFFLYRDEKIFTMGLFLMFASALPPLLVNDSLSIGFRELDLPSKYALFALIALLLFKIKPNISKDRLFSLICLGGIINGVIGVFHIFIFQDLLFHGRYTGYSGINETGFMCAIFGVLNLCLYLFYKNKYIFLIASILSIVALAGTGLRGTLLGTLFSFFVIIVIGFVCKKISLQRILKIAFVFLCLFVGIVYIVFQTLPDKRMEYTKSEMNAILSGKFDTSIGQRLVMYKEALSVFYLSPLIGMSAKTQLENAGEISKLSGFDKAIQEAEDGRKGLFGKKHNDTLTIMAQRGIIGLVCLLFFYFSIINIFYKQRDFIIFILGVSVLAQCIGGGFSGDPLSGHPESTFFALILLALLSTKREYTN